MATKSQSSTFSSLPVILQSVREISPTGGVSGVAYNLERQFQSLDYAIEHFTMEDIGIKLSPTKKSENFFIKKLSLTRDILAYSILGSLKLWVKYKLFKKGEQVIVITHNDALYGDIYVMHGSLKAHLLNNHKGIIKNPVHLFMLLRDELRYFLNLHKKYIVLCEDDKANLQRLYGVKEEQLVVIPNGVDLDRFQPNPEVRRQIRQSLGISENTCLLIFTGHEFIRKGLPYVIQSLKILKQKGYSVELLVAGRDNPDRVRDAISELGESGHLVHFLGSRSNVEDYYAAADVFVLPTSYEAWPLVGIEALASGLPILMTPVGGIKDYLQDGKNGFFIERNAADIAEKIERIIKAPDLREEMIKKARISSLNFSWENTVRKYIDVIAKVYRES